MGDDLTPVSPCFFLVCFVYVGDEQLPSFTVVMKPFYES